MSFKTLVISETDIQYESACIVHNYTDALKRLQVGDIELILIDMEMLEFFGSIKSYVLVHNIPVMLINAAIKNDNYIETLGLFDRYDFLTGLYNKNYFNIAVKALCDKMIKNKSPLSLVVIDLDSFKKVNDSQGHLAGDEMIKQVAKMLKDSIRNQDLLARFGGEEFILALPFASADCAFIVAERMRKLIERELSITASFGISEYIQDESLEDLINRADKALYHAKACGKNITKID